MKSARTEHRAVARCRSAEKSDNISVISAEGIETLILLIRGQKVILDVDLAELYGVTTKRLNEQVKRNIKRFPKDFMFSLTYEEKSEVVANCDHLASIRFSHQNPHAFTEQGIAMLSSVLNSDRAILVNIAIMRAFVRIRQLITFNKEIIQKLSKIEQKVGQHDQDIIDLFNAINKILRYEEQPKKKFGFV
ncbi:MAG: ORF6N domain-containing protein [Candidatus Margulisiibacteriota bacterium]